MLVEENLTNVLFLSIKWLASLQCAEKTTDSANQDAEDSLIGTVCKDRRHTPGPHSSLFSTPCSTIGDSQQCIPTCKYMQK